jgi:hypothetical protein
MPKGDHLVVSFGAYQHHAIDLGNGTVIQYGDGNLSTVNKVEIIPMETLVGNREVFVLDQPAEYDADEIVLRATSRISEKNYSLFSNNCEHFVNWCRTGQATSRQVDRTFQRAASCLFKLTAKGRVRTLLKSASSAASKRVAKSASPWMLLADATQLGVEVAASHHGADAKQAERIGQSAGLGTSVGIGAIAGGPAGAVAGASLWAIGEVAGRMISQSVQPVSTAQAEKF